jgi:hypothetical protein
VNTISGQLSEDSGVSLVSEGGVSHQLSLPRSHRTHIFLNLLKCFSQIKSPQTLHLAGWPVGKGKSINGPRGEPHTPQVNISD